MRLFYRILFIVFILIPMQVSFNNFGLSILHNEIDDIENVGSASSESVSTKDTTNENILLPNPDSNLDGELTENGNSKIEPLSDQTEANFKESEETKNQIPNDQEIKSDLVITEANEIKVENIKTVEAPPIDQLNKTETKGVRETPSEVKTSTEQAPVVFEKKTKPDIESFEEWKDIKLKEKAKLKAENKQLKVEKKNLVPPVKAENKNISDAPVDTDDEDDDYASAITQQRKNYASPDCGAKLIGNNPESNHPSHILSESKDDYMLNSCSNRIWFAIELCEPIKIKSFELANLELFSNVPRVFRVYASERFIQTSKDWPSKYLIGTFEAENVRSIQSFSIKDAITHSPTNESLSANASEQASPNPASVIIYAKYVRFEMISHYGNQHYCPLSLVRVYGSSMTDDHEEDLHNEEEDISVPVSKDQENPIETSIQPPVHKSGHFIKTVTLINEISTSFYNNIISILAENFSNLDHLFTFDNKEIKSSEPSTSLSNEQKVIQNDFYKIMCKCNLFGNNEFLDCCQCFEKFKLASKNSYHNNSFNWLSDKCGYFIMISTQYNERLANYMDKIKFSLPINDNTIDNTYQKTQLEIKLNEISYVIENALINENIEKSAPHKQPNRIDEVTGSEDLKQASKNTASHINENTSGNEKINSELKESVSQSDSQDLNVQQSSSNNEISGGNLESIDGSEVTEKEIMNPDSNTVPIEVPELPIAPQTEISTSEVDHEELQSLDFNPTTTTTPTSTTTSTKSSTKPPVKESVLVYGKEAVFMRLSNRIKILELNMSLSSQYLEKLSQHYRIQMDEMETTFNFTTNALKEATRVSDERDQKQYERIYELEKRLESLQKSVEVFNILLNNFKFQTEILAMLVAMFIIVTGLVKVVRVILSNKKTRKSSKQAERFPNHHQLTQKQLELLIEKRFHSLIQEFVKTTHIECKAASTAQLDDIESLGPKLTASKAFVNDLKKKIQVI